MKEEELKEILDLLFPYYEDMTDIELVQTASRRVGAERIVEYLDEHKNLNINGNKEIK